MADCALFTKREPDAYNIVNDYELDHLPFVEEHGIPFDVIMTLIVRRAINKTVARFEAGIRELYDSSNDDIKEVVQKMIISANPGQDFDVVIDDIASLISEATANYLTYTVVDGPESLE